MKGWKTVLFALAVALSGFLADENVKALIVEHSAISTTTLAAIIVALRAITTSAIFQKG